MKKRALSLLLCLVLLLSLVPTTAMAALVSHYTPRRTEAMVLPQALWKNKSYMVGVDLRRSFANYMYTFMPVYIVEDVYQNMDSDGPWSMELDQTMKENRQNAGIRATIGARMQAGWYYKGTDWTYTELCLNDSHPLASHNGERYMNLGFYQYDNFSVPFVQDKLTLQVKTFDPMPLNGNALTKDLAVYLVDDTAPTIRQCEITRNGELCSQIRPGDKLTMTLVFSEFIRFADDDPGRKPRLQFELFPIIDGGVRENLIQYAEFESLEDNKMVFSYEVPMSYPGYEGIRSFRFEHIKQLESNPDFSDKQGYTVKLLPQTIAQTMEAPALKSDVLITDLAGNPVKVDPQRSTTKNGVGFLPRDLIFDMEPPHATQLQIVKRNEVPGPDGKLSSYLVGGDELDFYLHFDEPIYVEAQAVTASFNLKNGSQPLQAKNLNTCTGDTDWLHFRIQVAAHHTLEPVTMAGAEAPFHGLTITSLDAAAVKDAAGQSSGQIDLVQQGIGSDKEYRLDTKAPLFEAPDETGSKISWEQPIDIQPMTGAQFGGAKHIFCVPVRITDPAAAHQSASGIDNQTGTFWLDHAMTPAYSFYVSTDGSLSAAELESLWKDSSQVSGDFRLYSGRPEDPYNTYIYVKLPLQEQPNPQLYLMARDGAGNSVTRSARILCTIDATGPVLDGVSEIRVSANVDGTYNLAQDVSFRDDNGIDAAAVRVTDRNNAFKNLGLGSHTQADLLLKEQDRTKAAFTLVWKNLEIGTDLHTTVAYEVRDGHGNTSTLEAAFAHTLTPREFVRDVSRAAGENGYIRYLELTTRHSTFDTEPDMRNLVLVQDPDHPDLYAARTVEPISEYNLLEDTQAWSLYRKLDTAGPVNGLLLEPVPGGSVAFLSPMGKAESYYGDITYLIISGKGITLEMFTKNDKIQTPVTIRQEHRRVADFAQSGNASQLRFGFTAEPIGWSFQPEDLEQDYHGDLSYKPGAMPQTGDELPALANCDAAGKSLRITLQKPTVPGFDWSDVAKIQLRIQERDVGFSDSPAYETELARTDQPQTVQISDAFRRELVDGFRAYELLVTVHYRFPVLFQGDHGLTDGLTERPGFYLHEKRGFDYLQKLELTSYISNVAQSGSMANLTYAREFVSAQETESAVVPVTLQPLASNYGTLCFGANGSSHTDYVSYVRVWLQGATHEADEAARAAAGWTNWKLFSLEDYVKKPGLVTLSYQSFSATDGLSPVRSVTLEGTDQGPILELQYSPDPALGYAAERTLELTKAEDQNGSPLQAYRLTGGDAANPVFAPMQVGDKLTVNSADPMGFYVVSESGGFATQTMTAPKLDRNAPVLTASVEQDTVSLTITDEYIDGENLPFDLYLRYDDAAYTELLKKRGLPADDGGWFHVAEAFESGVGFYPGGRYGVAEETVTVTGENRAELTLRLMSPKDSSGYNGTMTFYYVDSLGRKSQEVQTTPIHTEPMQITGTFATKIPDPYFREPNFILAFNYPVTVESLHPLDIKYKSAEIIPYGTYTMERPGLPVYAPGDYTIGVRDLFGDLHTVPYTVPEAAFNGQQLNVTRIREVIDGQSVMRVTIESPNGNEFRIADLTESSYEGREGVDPLIQPAGAKIFLADGTEGETWTYYSEPVELRFAKSGAMRIFADNDRASYDEFLLCVQDSLEPAALEESWNYPNGLMTEENGKTWTEGYATVTVKAQDPTRAVISGNVATFTDKDPVGTVKTLRVTDDSGMVQSHKVTLQTEIRPEKIPYTQAPDLTVTISAQRNGGLYPLGSVEANGVYETMLQSGGTAVDYRLALSTRTPHPCKPVLLEYQADVTGLTYAGAKNAVIDGLTLSGNLLTVSRADAKFSLILVDDQNGKSTRLDFNGGFLVDNTPPVVEITREVRGYEKVKLSLKVTDDQCSFADLIVAAPPGVVREKDSFTYEATENKKILFVVKDACGNTTTQQVEITEIDMTPVEATVVSYSPSAERSQVDPPELTNRDVTAYISFTKQIKEARLLIWDDSINGDRPAAPADGISLVMENGNSARIVFSRDGFVMLEYTALNGTVGEPMILMIRPGVIDKTPPAVTATVTELLQKDAAAPYGAEISLVPRGEEMIYYQGKPCTAQEPVKQLVYESGTYEFTFSDAAGNTHTEHVPVKGLDTTKPELTLPEDLGKLEPGDTFRLSANKPVTLHLPKGLTGGTEITGPDGGSVTITANESGLHLIEAADQTGHMARTYVAVGSGDVTPPVLVQKSSYVYLRQGTAPKDVTDAVLLQGLKVLEDPEHPEKVRLTVDRTGIPADFETLGTWIYTVTATDEAGNQAKVERSLSIFDREQTTVILNGEFARHTGVISTVLGTYPITVSLPSQSIGYGQFEPYKVYCARGYFTVGEMKPYMHPLPALGRTCGSSDAYEFTFSESGWYTVYVLRQNRDLFLTHVLVQ